MFGRSFMVEFESQSYNMRQSVSPLILLSSPVHLSVHFQAVIAFPYRTSPPKKKPQTNKKTTKNKRKTGSKIFLLYMRTHRLTIRGGLGL